jgi:hypothetical protein
VVLPVLAGLVHQRQRAEPAHPLVRFWHRLGQVGGESLPEDRVHDRGAEREHVHAEPECRGQHVADGDRAAGRHGLVEFGVDALEDLTVGELGQPRVHHVVEAQPALVDQDHRGGDGDRLGRRGHPEDRVAAHRRPTVVTHRPDRFDVRLTTPADQGDHPGDPAGVDVPLQHVVQAQQSGLGKAVHRVLLAHGRVSS